MGPKPANHPQPQLADLPIQTSSLDISPPSIMVSLPNDTVSSEADLASAVAEGDDDNDLEYRFRESLIADEHGEGLLPSKLIGEFLSKDDIAKELSKYESQKMLTKPVSADIVWGDGKKEKYLTIFALLLLVRAGHEIPTFIEQKVHDGLLPLVPCPGTEKRRFDLCRRDATNRPLKCFRYWDVYQMQAFEKWQWRLTVPFLGPIGPPTDIYEAPHYKFEEQTILPWCFWKTSSSSRSKGVNTRDGGYGSVTKVKIDPRCHGFHDILDKVSETFGKSYGYLSTDEFFTLKVLYEGQWDGGWEFQHKVDQLKRFNGLVHAHLVTLLATFTLKRRYYFLFPYAKYDLETYWESILPKPAVDDVNMVRWFSKQISGIMAAIHIIHEPPHLTGMYGRYGDLTPDNILWYNCKDDPNGIFVISGMGLSSLNSERSRSNIPNKTIPAVTGYRPPECDDKGGTISRAYDIWTLGCLFMEMVAWFLGGSDLREEFSEARMSLYITGVQSNIFYDVKEFNPGDHDDQEVQRDIKHVFQVKPEVTRWFRVLRNKPSCSQFFHDILDTIEQEMLVCLSKDRQRARSGRLREKFQSFHDECMRDPTYCMEGIPEPMPLKLRVATAVEADLNEIAQHMIARRNTEIPTYSEILRRSMLPKEPPLASEEAESSGTSSAVSDVPSIFSTDWSLPSGESRDSLDGIRRQASEHLAILLYEDEGLRSLYSDALKKFSEAEFCKKS